METLWHGLLDLHTKLENEDDTHTLYKYLHKNPENIWLELMNEPNQVYSEDVGRGYGKVIKTMINKPYYIKNKILIGGNYWSGIHAQIDPSGNGDPNDKHSIYTPPSNQGKQRTLGKKPAQELLEGVKHEVGHEVISLIDKQQLVFTVHQYMDLNSTGLWGCHDVNSNKITTVNHMVTFTRFNLLTKWAADQGTSGIKLFVSEIGAVPHYWDGKSTGCVERLNLFLQMIEENDSVLGWTLWRGVPNVSWAFSDGKVDPPKKADGTKFPYIDSKGVRSWSNRVFWGEPSMCKDANGNCDSNVCDVCEDPKIFTSSSNNSQNSGHKHNPPIADTGGLWKLGGRSSTTFYKGST